MTESDGLSDKTWMQLRQCTRIAMTALRHLADGSPFDRHSSEARQALADMEKMLAEGSTDPVNPGPGREDG